MISLKSVFGPREEKEATNGASLSLTVLLLNIVPRGSLDSVTFKPKKNVVNES